MFNTSGVLPMTITGRLQGVCKEYKAGSCINILIAEKKIVKAEYNYQFGTPGYVIAPGEMVPMIKWLYETDDGNNMLDILLEVYQHYSVEQTQLQTIIVDYINSHYKKVKPQMVLVPQELQYLVGIVDDTQFLSFLKSISEGSLLNLLNYTFDEAYNRERLLNVEAISTLITIYPFSKEENFDRMTSKLDLYSYLAYGTVDIKRKRSVKIPETHVIAALYAAYRGDFKQAMLSFAEAQKLFNLGASTIERRGIFPYSIVNFLFILCCAHLDDDKREHQFDVMLRRKPNNEIICAQLLVRILRNAKDQTLSDELRRAYISGKQMQKMMLFLLVIYSEKKDVLTEEAYRSLQPSWAILRFEYSRLSAHNIHFTSQTVKAYGEKPLLASIYRRQMWEQVLMTLTGTLQKRDTFEPTQKNRLAYYMENIYDHFCDVRLQTVLKNGSWSAGKVMPFHQFITLNADYMTPSDMLIRRRNERIGHTNGYQLTLTSVLPEMTEKSRLYVGHSSPYSIVTVTEEIPYIVVERIDGGFQIKSNVPSDRIEDNVIIVSRGASSINFIRMKDEVRPYFSHLLSLGFFPSEAEEQLKAFLPILGDKVEVHSPLVPGGSTLKTVRGQSMLTLQICPKGKDAYTVSLFCRPLDGGRVQCLPGEGSSTIIDQMDGRRLCVERQLEKEKEKADLLLDNLGDITQERLCFNLLKGQMMDVDAFELLPILDFVRMHRDDFSVEWPEGSKIRIYQRNTASQWRATLKKNKNGWFELEGELQIDENTVMSMQQLLNLMGTHRSRYVKLGDNEYMALSEKLRRQLMGLDALATRSRHHLQMSAFCAALLDTSLTDGELQIEVDEELKDIRRRILDSSEYKAHVPETLNATLRDYQKEGYQWIARLNSWGAGALLADDMGLGKTIQTIAYLLKEAKAGPSLVVAPASVAPNWLKEFEKFAPSLHVEMLNYAQSRSKCLDKAKAGDVVVTTYNLLLSVKEEIVRKEWNVLCLDEAHVIKNRGAKTSGVCMQLKSQKRIMLTGTPVQNHLGELWNLFQFVNPGLLGSYEDFGRRFITPIEVGKDEERQAQLERMVKPFMLRRTKENVLKELPEKTEIYQQVNLSEAEMAVYEVLREDAERMLLAEESQDRISLNTLSAITKLRQAACSAELVDTKWKGNTSKVQALVEALEPIVESNDAALVFSQFTSFLTIVKRGLDKAHIPYLYIDGSVSVKERQQLVEKFQNGECPVFLISLKAGGLGLNLTRANYVFHLDPWWNPAIEQQATDRAHRIGQHNAVTVYHFLSEGTIEEKIRRLHEQKRNLADSILEGTDMSGKMTGKELLELVANK